MRVLIADKFPQGGQDALRQLGAQVTFEPGLGAEDLAGAIGDHDILIVRSTKVPAAVFEKAKALQLVLRAGAGYNTIDVAAASNSGVYVANCPGKNAIAVAELAIGLLIGLDRRIPMAHAELKAGTWNKKEYGKAAGLFGSTFGVIGAGTIGLEVIKRAKALGMQVIVWSRSLDAERAGELGVRRADSLLNLAKACSAVSVHLAFTADTKGLLGAEFFAALPEGAMVINTARGGIVDEAALVTAMNERGIRYAADVFDGEPADAVAEFGSPVTQHAASVCTPHIGASTEQAQDAVSNEALRIVRTYMQTGNVLHCVNLCAQSPARWSLSVRHLDKVGVLANILSTIREADINVEEVQNVIFEGATAACATFKLDSEPSQKIIDDIAGFEHVIGVQLTA